MGSARRKGEKERKLNDDCRVKSVAQNYINLKEDI